MDLSNFKIITCLEEFEKLTSLDSPEDPRAFESIWDVHDFFIKETWIESKTNEFIIAIGNILDLNWKWTYRPTSKNDKLCSLPWRWQDSLSMFLLQVPWITREKYQRIMAFSNKWYLDDFYIKISEKLLSE